MGFEEHVKNCGRRFKLDTSKMLESWYTMPAFYYSNNLGIIGSDEPLDMHPNAKMFDFEFKIGFVIGKGGRNIPADRAMDHIFGYTDEVPWLHAGDLIEMEVQGIGTLKNKII